MWPKSKKDQRGGLGVSGGVGGGVGAVLNEMASVAEEGMLEPGLKGL